MPKSAILIIQSTFAFVNINTGKDYTIKEVKKMDREQIQNFIVDTTARNEQGKQKTLGQAELARRIGVP